MRICSKCKISKSVHEFVKDNRREDGFGYRCLVCHREIEKNRCSTIKGKASKKISDAKYRKINREKLNLQKIVRKKEGSTLIQIYKNNPCSDCAKLYPSECMELDHISGDKKYNVANMKSMNKNKIIQEIKKCEVVCSVCHRIRTSKRRGSSKNKYILAFRIILNNLKSNPCTDCEQIFPPEAMDFDHINGDKLFNISNMWQFPKNDLLHEIN